MLKITPTWWVSNEFSDLNFHHLRRTIWIDVYGRHLETSIFLDMGEKTIFLPFCSSFLPREEKYKRTRGKS